MNLNQSIGLCKSILRIRLFAFVIAFQLSGFAWADGQFEINQLCIASGCFAGDGPGLPVVITKPGSYQLTSNLIADGQTPVASIVRIESSSVSLDLDGHSIKGPTLCVSDGPICFSSLVIRGISTYSQTGSAYKNIQISNGVVQGFNGSCVETVAENVKIEDLRITDCGLNGIFLGGTGRIDSVVISDVGTRGISTQSSVVISQSSVINAGNTGVSSGICADNVFESNGDSTGAAEEQCSVQLSNNICSGSICP